MNKSIILYGPQGSGKTAVADRLARHLGLRYVVHDWDGAADGRQIGLQTDAVYVVNKPRVVTELRGAGFRCFHIDEAKRMLGIDQPANDNQDKVEISPVGECLFFLEKYAEHARTFSEQFHLLAVNAGWYTDLATGEPLQRNLGEMLCLIHSEISEAMEGERKDKMDDHLPHRKAAEVELADALIRIFDYAGYRGYDVIGAAVEKAAYNAKRADHKPENRRAAGGKAF